jgi:putative addiction module component (TIGR02574 family)
VDIREHDAPVLAFAALAVQANLLGRVEWIGPALHPCPTRRGRALVHATVPLSLGFAIVTKMSERSRKLLHDATDLPVSERAELAANLLASLDGEPEADVEAAWASEIERRAREALTNPDDDVAWETIRAGLHAAPTR